MKRNIFKIGFLILCFAGFQMTYAVDGIETIDSTKSYQNFHVYQPVQIDEKKLKQDDEVKNIILFIGDGMGIAQVFAAMTANHGNLNLEYLKYIGFSMTQSFDKYITDSAAAATPHTGNPSQREIPS